MKQNKKSCEKKNKKGCTTRADLIYYICSKEKNLKLGENMTVYKTNGMKAIESNTTVSKWEAKDYIEAIRKQLNVTNLDMRFKANKRIAKMDNQLVNMYYEINTDIKTESLTNLLNQVNGVLANN